MIPGIMAQRRAPSGGGALWTPLNMATVPQIYLDAQDSVVTDVSGFASAISNLGAMGANGNFTQSTSGQRPSIIASAINGKRALGFAGTNAVLVGATAQQKDLFRNVSAAWTFAVYKKRVTDSPAASRFLVYGAQGDGGTRYTHLAGWNAAANQPTMQCARQDSEGPSSLALGSSIVGSYLMTLSAINYASRAGAVYINGNTPTVNSTLTATAGSTDNTAASDNLYLGAATSGGAGPADVDLAAVIVSNTYPSAGDIDKLFGWAAHRYGLTASLPGGHPYKTVAPTV